MAMPSAATILLSSMPSATTLLSACTNFAASAMLVRRVLSDIQITLNQILPEYIQEKVMSKIASLFGDSSPPSRITLIFAQYEWRVSSGINEMYDASQTFLRLKIPPSAVRLKAFKKECKKLSLAMVEGERAMDIFEGVEVEWEVVSVRKHGCGEEEVRSINLSFPKENMETILGSYLPYVLERSRVFKQENSSLKFFSLDCCDWDLPIALNHPSTFETLAMDSKLKQDLINDLDRFVKRKDYYRRVGRAWKRGYLLYGPPGTGKSSLVAAMANYLKFYIYDFELTHVSNRDLRWLLVSTKNRSIIMIEDIDCSSELQEDQDGRLKLSGLLNFIDGLWSSCGDQRIIVLTTNHKDRLDPALLRPGRMDMHIHMSYCTPCGFKTLASNYLGVSNHRLFPEIERLITQVQVTPAQVAEELMKSDEADTALAELVVFLERLKWMAQSEGGLHQEAPNQGGLHQEAQNEGRLHQEAPIEGGLHQEAPIEGGLHHEADEKGNQELITTEKFVNCL